MRVRQNSSWTSFLEAADDELFAGNRIKGVRHQTLIPGGRSHLTLFEQVAGEGRAHPRLQVSMPPVEDPEGDASFLEVPADPPKTAAAFAAAVEVALEAASKFLAAEDLDEDKAPAGSERYYRNSVAAQRKVRFFRAATAWAGQLANEGVLPKTEWDGARYAIRSLEDLAHAGEVQFDDHDTGTYHSFGHDAPFVHYLEAVLAALPDDESEAMAILPTEQRGAVRRQRKQAQAHLDFLMRHKYANHGIKETDIEQSLGGFLICRETRHIVSETEASADSLQPEYELIRVKPSADHPRAGEYLYRDSEGGLRTQDHEAVEVDRSDRRHIGRKPEELSFRRAPHDLNLRSGVRFDWDQNGWVADEEIGWVSWAGHCDIKALEEQLGITLTSGNPTVTEWRSDTGEETVFDRNLLLEALTSVFELGSQYQTLDGGDRLTRGITRFGGARNDSRPDRLQFQGPGLGKSFRWPLTGRQDSFVVTKITVDGVDSDIDTVFMRNLPDEEALAFASNPRFLKTVEGDYNLIDVSGAVLEARVKLHKFDPATGYLSESSDLTTVDLSGGQKRYLLGTHLQDPQKRQMYRVFFEPKKNRIAAEMEQWQKKDGTYQPVRLTAEDVHLPMVTPLTVTLSREMKRDDPRVFEELLAIGVRQGQNINADTDAKAEVWNGTVTRIASERLAVNAEARTEHWQVDLDARFGSARLSYLLRRDDEGNVEDTCIVPSHKKNWDFLWQDFPDVGSKGVERGEWIVNSSMVERGLVEVEFDTGAPGGFYVYDDHVKNVFELCFCGLGGYPYTVMHSNKRYGYAKKGDWEDAKSRLKKLRKKVGFSD